MKKFFFGALLTGILFCSVLSSCASNSGVESAAERNEWFGICSLDQLKGKWLCPDDGTYYSYPEEFNGDGKKYLVYGLPEIDATMEWKSLADDLNVSLDALWEKNRTERIVVYSDGFGNSFPYADANGCMIDIEFRKEGDAIYRRHVYYFSEFVLTQNLDFFTLDGSENLLKERGVFRTSSITMPDLEEGTQIYYHQ